MSIFEKDILKGSEKELLKLKEEVLCLETCEKECKELESGEKEECKLKEKKKAEIDKEIAEYEKAARKAVEEPFDKEIAEITKVKTVKEAEINKKRKEEIQKRQSEETGDLKARKDSIRKDIEKIAEDDQIPGIGISKLFLTLYYPKTSTDVFALLVGFVVLVFGISFAVYKLCFPQSGISVLLILCETLIIFFLLLYILLSNTIKEKHLKAYQEINALRKEGNKANSEIKKINKQVAHVSDEELGLSEDIAELENLKKELENCLSQKKEELDKFDKDEASKQVRENEIRDKHKAEWDALTQKLDAIRVELDKKKSEIKEKEMALHTKYEELRNRDKNIFKIKRIDELIGYIQRKEANTIEEALNVNKKKEE